MITLTQTRGDTRSYYFKRTNADGSTITTQPTSLYFTVKRNYIVKDFVLQKTLDDMTVDAESNYHFTIEPEDTDKLDYGKYVFDIQVRQDGAVTTIAKGEFILTEEATWADNE